LEYDKKRRRKKNNDWKAIDDDDDVQFWIMDEKKVLAAGAPLDAT
jgi:hypothetical protein